MAEDPEEFEEEAGLFCKQTDKADRLRDRETQPGTAGGRPRVRVGRGLAGLTRERKPRQRQDTTRNLWRKS